MKNHLSSNSTGKNFNVGVGLYIYQTQLINEKINWKFKNEEKKVEINNNKTYWSQTNGCKPYLTHDTRNIKSNNKFILLSYSIFKQSLRSNLLSFTKKNYLKSEKQRIFSETRIEEESKKNYHLLIFSKKIEKKNNRIEHWS